MNGTIKCFSGQTGSGSIRSAHGETFDFELTGVLAYDVAKLAEGKLVHFDLASGPSPKAINISIDPACDVSAGRNGDREIMRLRYLGFENEGNLRLYCFQRLTPREQAQTFLVEADLLLFRRHQVHIQEGPALCLKMLLVGLECAGDPRTLARCRLTQQHLTAFVASQPVRGARSHFRNTRSRGQVARV
jgi:cold shock CspA family protein